MLQQGKNMASRPNVQPVLDPWSYDEAAWDQARAKVIELLLAK